MFFITQDLTCHSKSHDEFRFDVIDVKTKDIKKKVTDFNTTVFKDNPDQKLWLWREMVTHLRLSNSNRIKRNFTNCHVIM
jgi:hypothetical protein